MGALIFVIIFLAVAAILFFYKSRYQAEPTNGQWIGAGICAGVAVLFFFGMLAINGDEIEHFKRIEVIKLSQTDDKEKPKTIVLLANGAELHLRSTAITREKSFSEKTEISYSLITGKNGFWDIGPVRIYDNIVLYEPIN